MWTAADNRRVEVRLRELLSTGQTIEVAIRTIHQADGVGALRLCPAVQTITGASDRDVKRLIVRALFPLWWKGTAEGIS